MIGKQMGIEIILLPIIPLPLNFGGGENLDC